MAIEIKAPTYPESVQEGTIATWHKNAGDTVARDELVVDIETDKVVLEVVASASGTLTEVLKSEGDVVLSNEVIALLEEGTAEVAPAPAPSIETPQYSPLRPTPILLLTQRPRSLLKSVVSIYQKCLAQVRVDVLLKKMWLISSRVQPHRHLRLWTLKQLLKRKLCKRVSE